MPDATTSANSLFAMEQTSASRTQSQERHVSLPAIEQSAFAPAMKASFERVGHLAQLPDDWDSYGAQPPTTEAVRSAQHMLAIMYRRLAVRPNLRVQPTLIAPLADGGIQFEWNMSSTELAIQIGPTGALGYLLVTHDINGRHTEEADNVPWGQAIELIATTVFSA